MAIKVMADSGGTVTYSAAEVGAAFNSFAGGSDYIISDVGDEMAVTTSSSSLTVSVGSGRGMVCGRLVEVTSRTSFSIPASYASEANGVYVILRIDLSRPMGSEGSLTYCRIGQEKDENLNAGNSGKHDLILARVVINSTGVVSKEDMRNVTAVAGGSRFRVIKDEDGAMLATPITFEIVGVRGS